VSLEEAAAAADGQHPTLARVLFDLHPHSPYELSLRKVRLLVISFSSRSVSTNREQIKQ